MRGGGEREMDYEMKQRIVHLLLLNSYGNFKTFDMCALLTIVLITSVCVNNAPLVK